MTASYLVRYHDTAKDQNDFLSHYRNSHAPILKSFPGIDSLILHHGVDSNDPLPIIQGKNLLIAEMTFCDLPALNAALTSSARAEAREDFQKFPPFDGDVTHQAFVKERIF